MDNVDSINAEAIKTLKKDVDRISNKIESLCPKGLFYWVAGFIITICAMSFGSLFVLQSKTQTNIAAMSVNISQTQAGISRILNLIDSGSFVKKDDLIREVKGIVRQELYFFVREQQNIDKIKH